jgi:hypothetical protein
MLRPGQVRPGRDLVVEELARYLRIEEREPEAGGAGGTSPLTLTSYGP